MNLRTISLAGLLLLTGAALAGEPKLANPRPVFPTTQPDLGSGPGPNALRPFIVRLSPDGKRLLYPRPVPGETPEKPKRARQQFVLRELESGREVVLPVSPVDRGWETVCTRFNLFDPAGQRLALADLRVERQEVNTGGPGGKVEAVKTTARLVLYDVAAGRPVEKVPELDVMMGKFSADGKRLLTVGGADLRQPAMEQVALKDFSRTPISTTGFVQSVCPVGEVAVIYIPPARRAPPAGDGPRPARPPFRLVLWDLKADKELAQVPTHPQNSVLDDWETQWTADGQYLYYVDMEATGEMAGDRPKLRAVTHVYDRIKGEVIATVADALPVGPGPGKSQMLLARRPEKAPQSILLHDAATGQAQQVGAVGQKLLHAWGTKLVYAQADDAGKEIIYVADIVTDEPAKPAATQPTPRP